MDSSIDQSMHKMSSSSSLMSFTESMCRVTVAKLCHTVGWNSTHISALNVLSELLQRHIKTVSADAVAYANHCGRSQPSFEDLLMSLANNQFDFGQFQDYITNVDPSPLDFKIPFYPIPNRANRVLDCVDSDEERAEYYYEWLPSLKCKSSKASLELQNNINNNNTINNNNNKDSKLPDGNDSNATTTKNVDGNGLEQNGSISIKDEVMEDDDEIAQTKPKGEDDGEKASSEKKLVFKFSLSKSVEEPPPSGDDVKKNNDPSKGLLVPGASSDEVTAHLHSSRAFLKFSQSCLLMNPDNEEARKNLHFADQQRLPNDHVTRENTPERDMENSNDVRATSNDLDFSIKIKAPRKKNRGSGGGAKANSEDRDEFGDIAKGLFGDIFGHQKPPSIKVKEIGEGSSRKSTVSRKKPKDARPLNIKVTLGNTMSDDAVDKDLTESIGSAGGEECCKKKAAKGKKPKGKAKKDDGQSPFSELFGSSSKKPSSAPSIKSSFSSFEDRSSAADGLLALHDSMTADGEQSTGELKRKLDDSDSKLSKKSSNSRSAKRPKLNTNSKFKSAATIESSGDSSSEDESNLEAPTSVSLASVQTTDVTMDSNEELAVKATKPSGPGGWSSPSSVSSHDSDLSMRSERREDKSKPKLSKLEKLKEDDASAKADQDREKKKHKKKKEKREKHREHKHGEEKERHKKHKKRDKEKDKEKERREKKEKERDKSQGSCKDHAPKLNIKFALSQEIKSESEKSPSIVSVPEEDSNDSRYSRKKEVIEKKKSSKVKPELTFIKDPPKSKEKLKNPVINVAASLMAKSDEETPVKKSKVDGAKSAKGKKDEKSAKKELKSLKKSSSPLPESASKKVEEGPVPSTSGAVCKVWRETVEEAGDYEEEWNCPVCGKSDIGDPMIQCDKCESDWYHYLCVGIVKDPGENERWFCPNCRKTEEEKAAKRRQEEALPTWRSGEVTITPVLPYSPYGSFSPAVNQPFCPKPSKLDITITPTGQKRPRGRPRKDSTNTKPSLTITTIPAAGEAEKPHLPIESSTSSSHQKIRGSSSSSFVEQQMKIKSSHKSTPSLPSISISEMPKSMKRCFKCKFVIETMKKVATCDKCQNLFHWVCLKIKDGSMKWDCPACKPSPGVVVKEETEIKPIPSTSASIKELWPPAGSRGAKHKSSKRNPVVIEEDDEDEQNTRCYTCKTDEYSDNWIACDMCNHWFHFKCQGVEVEPAGDESWFCRGCIQRQMAIESKLTKKNR